MSSGALLEEQSGEGKRMPLLPEWVGEVYGKEEVAVAQRLLDEAVVQLVDQVGWCQTGPVSGGPRVEGMCVLRLEG